MMRSQKMVHEMLKALGIPLLNEDQPRVSNIRFELLRSLVVEEANEFEMSMVALALCSDRPPRWRSAMMNVAHGLEKDEEERDKLEAMSDQDLVLYWWAEVIDAMCDIIVVVHNTSNAMGIDLEPFFDEVHQTNMAKADGPVREDGKKLKPEGWRPPQIREILEATLERHKEK